MEDTNGFMSAGKAPTALDFGKVPGIAKGGTILAGPTEYHVREYNPLSPGQGPLKYYEDGNPVKGWHFDLQTTERETPDDKGIRRLYVDKGRMREAIQEAIRAAGAISPQVGDQLFVTWTGEELGAVGLPAKTWAAQYIPKAAIGMMAPQVPVAPQAFPQAPQLCTSEARS